MHIIKLEVVKLLKGYKNLSKLNIESLLEKPRGKNRGDYALACFSLSKLLKESPQKIASDISNKIKPSGLISSVQAQGGYVNFYSEPSKLIPLIINQILSEKEKYGTSTQGKGKTIVLDYSSPNIAKPMGIGHLRSTVIGHALYNIYKSLGYNCFGINYLGDWGTQFGMLIADFKENNKLYNDRLYGSNQVITSFLAQRYIKYNEEIKNKPQLIEKAKTEFNLLENGDIDNQERWTRLKKFSIKEFKRIYDLLNVTFDQYSGESETNNYVNKAIDEIKNKELTQTSEGALIVNLKKHGMTPCLLKKSDGATLYAARDIAAAINRYQTHKFHKLLYVVGSDQKLHFRQIFKVLELMKYPWVNSCVHVDFGLVRLKGEKMSTRKGKTIILEEVLNEAIQRSKDIMKNRSSELTDKISPDKVDAIAKAVGIGAIIFNDLKNKRSRNIDFDWGQILSFDGETGPYLQYTHTRLASLLDKARDSGYKISEPAKITENILSKEEEINLIKLLGEFPSIILKSAQMNEPSIVSNYLLEISSVFNRFYKFHRIISKETHQLSQARITLVLCLKYVLSKGLKILGITPLEKM